MPNTALNRTPSQKVSLNVMWRLLNFPVLSASPALVMNVGRESVPVYTGQYSHSVAQIPSVSSGTWL